MIDELDDHHWYPVRCCCTPTKIFGFLRVEGDRRSYEIVDHRGKIHKIDIRQFKEITEAKSPKWNPTTLVTPELAIYSEDRPIRFWRTIPGFVECKV